MPETGLSKAQYDKNGVLWMRFCIFTGRVIGVLAAAVGALLIVTFLHAFVNTYCACSLHLETGGQR